MTKLVNNKSNINRYTQFLHQIIPEANESDFFSLLRHIDALCLSETRLGYAESPQDEPLRVGLEPYLKFATSTIERVEPSVDSSYFSLLINHFGLLGPNGPLPLNITEYAFEKLYHDDNPSLPLFLNFITHRLALFFYRAWADVQPTVSLDRIAGRKFEDYFASLIGSGPARFRKKGKVSDHVLYFLSGHFSRSNRDLEGLCKILSCYFNVPIKISENSFQWIKLDAGESLTLHNVVQKRTMQLSNFLGMATLGIQHSFRITMGPVDNGTYSLFLPEGLYCEQLIYLVERYLGLEFCWDLNLILAREDISGVWLGDYHRLGLSTWLGYYNDQHDCAALIFTPVKLKAFLQIKNA